MSYRDTPSSSRAGGVDVARDREVDQQQRPAGRARASRRRPRAPPAAGAGEAVAATTMSARSSASGSSSNAHAVAAVAPGQLTPRGRAGGWRRTRSAAPLSASARAGQLARLAGADDHDLAAAQRSRAARARAPRPRPAGSAARSPIAVSVRTRLPVGSAAVNRRLVSGPVGLLGERGLVGALDLPLDLGLADDHRLEPRDDAVQVPRRIAVAVRVDRGRQAGRPDPRLARRASSARRSRPRPDRPTTR